MPSFLRRTTLVLVSVSGTFLLGSAALGTACTWPDYTTDLVEGDAPIGDSDASSGDVSPDAPKDTAIADTTFVLPDGRSCTGHDEDGDGVPDECDNCPNVQNKSQTGGDVGDACKGNVAFLPTSTRLLFDPLRSISGWKPFGAQPETGPAALFVVDKDGDSLLGGSTSDSDLRFLVGGTGSGGSATVVTTIMDVQGEDTGGSAGVLLRVTGSPQSKFFICALSVANGFAAARAPDTGCSGGGCGPVAFPLSLADGGVSIAQLAIPPEVPHGPSDTIGLRASVTKGDGATSGDFECRIFDPKVPSSVLTTDTRYSVKVPVPTSRWLPSGEVGLYAQKSRTQFLSVDVLRGP